MKQFKSFINETHTSHQNQAVDQNTNMSALSDPSVQKKLNAWVGSIAGNYILPEEAISKLRSSLSKIGLWRELTFLDKAPPQEHILVFP